MTRHSHITLLQSNKLVEFSIEEGKKGRSVVNKSACTIISIFN